MASILGTSPPGSSGLRTALDAAGFGEGLTSYQVAWWCAAADADLVAEARQRGRVLVLVDEPEDMRFVAWELLALGAEDVVEWSGDETARHVVDRLARWRAVDEVLESPAVTGLIVGQSQALRRALAEVVELAMFGAGPILLVGETGTGKELAARLAHDVGSGSGKGQLVVLDCTTIVPSLSGSELFGHERGAFTGADRAREGAFSTANGGTLFLDEIGELPMRLQAEVLRVLQEGTFKRVGGDGWSTTRFRLVSATNRDLAEEQAAGRFRSDLYHRIASGVVRLPPLRERDEDIAALFSYFLAEALPDVDVRVSTSVLAMVRERTFPGNLRELRQLAFAIAARHAGEGAITPGDVPPRLRPDAGQPCRDPRALLEAGVRECLASGVGLPALRTMVGDLAVDIAMESAGGNAHRAAAALGVTDRAIQLRKKAPKTRPDQG